MTKWKLVPVDPTPEMDNAARDWSVSKYGRGIGNDAAHGCYSAMLEAAPPAPSVPSVPDGWKHDCAGIMQNDVELWLDSCPHCGKPKTDAAPTPAEAPADVARDAERWRMLPAFLEEFEISYLRLEDAIDAAIAAEKGQQA